MVRTWDKTGWRQWHDKIQSLIDEPRLIPDTINEFVELCARDAPIPEGGEPGSTPCLPLSGLDLITHYHNW